MLIGVLITAFERYRLVRSVEIKELEEAAYSKALELHKIAKQIREIESFFTQFQSCYKNEIYENVGIIGIKC